MQDHQGHRLVHVQLRLASPIKTGFTPDPYAILPTITIHRIPV